MLYRSLLIAWISILILWSCQFPNPNKPNEVVLSATAPKPGFSVIAYYFGNASLIDSFEVEKLTHIIFSFGHLKGDRLSIDNAKDTAAIHKLVSLKKRNPSLKVILSLGGWGGCEFCSPVFATAQGRSAFASSAKQLAEYFKTDGIDLDWEYPAIEGHPGHAWTKADRPNFTFLVKSLRDTLGNQQEISFAAGGFDKFLRESIEWDKVMPLVDKVNLMTYDLVHGFSTVTGHHTPIYSTPRQKQSADNVVGFLDSIKVPLQKLIIGAAFYARVWENVSETGNGLYQSGKFKSFVPFNQFNKWINADSGYTLYFDSTAMAPYAYNVKKKLFATFDDPFSITLKTKYALKKGLGGIMFWELSLDKRKNGLLEAIDKARRE
jgi:chitinase